MTHNAENVPPQGGSRDTEVERLVSLADRLAGKIARVEALTESATDFDEVGLGWVSVSEIRAALDGFPHEARQGRPPTLRPRPTDLEHPLIRRLFGLPPKPPKHHHDYQRVGYGGAGWSLYRCTCGAEEINA